jgi:hypothetical protein
MKVDQRKKVSAFQAAFKEEFGVGIRLYQGNRLADDVALRKLSPEGAKGGDINFGGNTKVKNVEKAFLTELGIKVQVENKKGGLANNDKTLASLIK